MDLRTASPAASRWMLLAAALLALCAAPASSQTVSGRLLDVRSGRPIDLGILVLLTLEGDTVGLTATTADGGFSIAASEPGVFLVQASAFGYTPRQEGEFELGEGGVMYLEFRLAPLALALEDMIVSVDRPRADHPLLRNGFVRRYQQGFGHFITPRDLERTVYRDTESLFQFIPGVRVVTSHVSDRGGGQILLGPTYDHVVVRGPFQEWCTPTVYIDGVWSPYRPDMGETLDLIAPIGWIEAVEIYRGSAEIPPEYTSRNGCGVVLIWLKR